MSEPLIEDVSEGDDLAPHEEQKKAARHPLTLENTPERTLEVMRGFPERAAKLRELIRGLRETDAG
jgi:hypothetical protein